MPRKLRTITPGILAFVLAVSSPVQGQQPEDMVLDQGWPRIHTKGDSQVTIHQPQMDAWTDYTTIKFRSAIEVVSRKDAEPVYGVAEGAAKTGFAPATTQTRWVQQRGPAARKAMPSSATAARMEAASL